MLFVRPGLWTLCVLAFASVSTVSVAGVSDDQQCSSDDEECGPDRNLLLQLPGVSVDPSVLVADYKDSEFKVPSLGGDRPANPPGEPAPGEKAPAEAAPVDPHNWKEQQKEIFKDLKMKTNNVGDLPAFMSSLMVDTFALLMMGLFFCSAMRRYPLVYIDNLTIGATDVPLPETWLGWVTTCWNLSFDEIEKTAGLDGAMLIEFVNLAFKAMLTVGVPMMLIVAPLHAFAGGKATDKLSKIGMGNVVSGEGARWVYWVHALMMWYVVVMVYRLIFQAQEMFLKRRYDWMLKMPSPRNTTVLVEGIPDECCTDQALKERFCKLFPGDKVTGAYIVRKTSKLVTLVDYYNSTDHSLHEANFEWQAAGGSQDVRPQIRDAAFGKMVDKIGYYEEQKKVAEADIALERQALQDPTRQQLVLSNSGFVSFKTEQDAMIALCLKVRADEYVYQMSTPPDPADVQYCDLYVDENTLHLKALIGYACLAAIFFGFTPIILAISSVLNLTALRQTIPLVDKLVVAVPMSQRLLEGVLASAALTLFMSFLPTILTLIFDNFYQLKAGRWAQHRLQIWYFWFQVIFVLLVTAVGSSLFGTIGNIVNHPMLVFDLLATRLPEATHFYLNYMVMQWVVHAMNLTRYINLIKFKLLSAICDEKRAKELSEPEDQDYYGIGGRSARFALNLVIGLVYCSLCPLITVVTGINFMICKVVYSYLLVFAEGRKADLGGHFWVTQLRHIQYGLVLYVLLMAGVLSQRSASIGPTILAVPALAFLARNWLRFHSAYEWEFMPFEEMISGQERKASWGKASAIRASSRDSYEQPELSEPVLSE